MKRQGSIGAVLLALVLACAPALAEAVAAGPAALPAADDEFRWLDTELFSLQVPKSWAQVSDSDLVPLQAQADRIIREIFPLDDTSAVTLDRVLWMNAFESDDRSTRLFLLISEIPPPAGAGRPYLENKLAGYLDFQRAQAAVDRVEMSAVEELNGMPAVEATLRLADGWTAYTVNVWTSVYRDRVGTIVALTKPEALAWMGELVGRLVASVKPSPAVAAAQERVVFRHWLREKVWMFEGSASDALGKRIVVILVVFTLCFSVSLRLIYEGVLIWYRWRNMEDRVIEMARRAARDALRLGYFYSQGVTMACALLSMTATTAALVWIARP